MAKQFEYAKAKQELIDLLDWFDSGNADLDQALDNYKKAEALIKELESYLKQTEKDIKLAVKNK